MQGTMLGVDDDRDGDVKTHVCVNSMWRWWWEWQGRLKINDDDNTNCGLPNGHKEEEGDDDGDDGGELKSWRLQSSLTPMYKRQGIEI